VRHAECVPLLAHAVVRTMRRAVRVNVVGCAPTMQRGYASRRRTRDITRGQLTSLPSLSSLAFTGESESASVCGGTVQCGCPMSTPYRLGDVRSYRLHTSRRRFFGIVNLPLATYLKYHDTPEHHPRINESPIDGALPRSFTVHRIRVCQSTHTGQDRSRNAARRSG
jgi:hypothetical protein